MLLSGIILVVNSILMKAKFLLLIVAAIFLQVTTSSCSRSRKVVIIKQPTKVKTLPPGQAKKVTGSQSAKAYAPGQQKKKY
jgi:hypothetical protein